VLFGLFLFIAKEGISILLIIEVKHIEVKHVEVKHVEVKHVEVKHVDKYTKSFVYLIIKT
jgi:hypothetical protein